jgi:ABC-type bacteriocin/lantibiotic exporter with double-glycine peptidase domain
LRDKKKVEREKFEKEIDSYRVHTKLASTERAMFSKYIQDIRLSRYTNWEGGSISAHKLSMQRKLSEFISTKTTCSEDVDDKPDEATFKVYKAPRCKLDIDFENLRLTVESTKKTVTIVAGVSGTIPAGSSVAIMGESGAGKTSLLNVLCGRAHYGTTTGVVKINGEARDINTVASMVGFVPQVSHISPHVLFFFPTC